MELVMKVLKSFVAATLLTLSLPSLGLAQYVRTDLVSNQIGVGTAPPDTQLLNAWGLTQLRGSPFWASDNGSGFSTLYTGNGTKIKGLVVSIPAAPGSPMGTLGTPTGIVGNISNNITDFTITDNTKSPPVSGQAAFIFATLDGTVCGWSPIVDGLGMSHATCPPGGDRSGVGAVYTGLAIGTDSHDQIFLYAADDGPNRRVDMFNNTFTVQPQAFEDPAIPRNFAPYGIQNINGDIWVTYTALDKAQGGFVDKFDADGNLKTHMAVQGPLHSPWGLAQAPSDFGPMGNAILVSNNTSRGRINAFDPDSGDFLGPLRDANNNPIEIDEVWALQFGHDSTSAGTSHKQLFFTAGPNNYGNGLFGVITVAK